MSDFPTIDQLQDRFVSIIDELIHLQRERIQLERMLSELKDQPITDANEHWRADRNGDNTILELLHSTDSAYFKETGRRREYIGKDPARIAAAREARQRYNRVNKINSQLVTIDDKARGILRYFERLEYFALGMQKSLWGQDKNSGDRSAPASPRIAAGLSPQDLSPQDIADYFKNSEALHPHYDDLRKVPAFSEVNFNRG